jgi:aminoglycoside 6'-N-acetyltransferase I
MIEVKSITKDDIEKCANLICSAYGGPPWNYQWQPETAIKYLTELYESSRFQGFCIYEQGNVVAALFAHIKTWWIDELLMIDELFVSPNKQGRGYGQALMNSAKEFCDNNNIGSITLITNKYMPAVRFYEKNHFLQAEQYTLMFT